MRVCVLFVNYRNAPDIAGAVASVLEDDPGSEVVVVDNSDDVMEWAQLQALLPQQVHKVRAPANLGFGQGCNFGLAHTDAEFIFLVNPDVRLLPGCTQALLQCMVANPKLGAVSPQQFLDSDCQWRLPPSWLPTKIRAWVTERALREPEVAARLMAAAHAEHLRFWHAQGPIGQRALSGAAMLVRRAALPAGEPMFDPRYFMYFEDTDLCMRLRRRGWQLALTPDARAVHAWRNQAHKGVMMAKSAPQYFEKFFPAKTSWTPRASAAQAISDDGPTFERFPSGSFEVPLHWSDGWVMELSPSPLINPAIARLGRGRFVGNLAQALAHFESAPVYGRLSRLSGTYDPLCSRAFFWAAGNGRVSG